MKLRSGRVLNEASIIMELKMLFLKSCVALLQSENKEISNFSIDSVTNDEALLYFAWHLSGPDATPVPSEDMVKFLGASCSFQNLLELCIFRGFKAHCTLGQCSVPDRESFSVLSTGCGNDGFLISTNQGSNQVQSPTGDLTLTCSNGVLSPTGNGVTLGSTEDVSSIQCNPECTWIFDETTDGQPSTYQTFEGRANPCVDPTRTCTLQMSTGILIDAANAGGSGDGICLDGQQLRFTSVDKNGETTTVTTNEAGGLGGQDRVNFQCDRNGQLSASFQPRRQGRPTNDVNPTNAFADLTTISCV